MLYSYNNRYTTASKTYTTPVKLCICHRTHSAGDHLNWRQEKKKKKIVKLFLVRGADIPSPTSSARS